MKQPSNPSASTFRPASSRRPSPRRRGRAEYPSGDRCRPPRPMDDAPRFPFPTVSLAQSPTRTGSAAASSTGIRGPQALDGVGDARSHALGADDAQRLEQPGDCVRPVTATRTGMKRLPAFSPSSSASARKRASVAASSSRSTSGKRPATASSAASASSRVIFFGTSRAGSYGSSSG